MIILISVNVSLMSALAGEVSFGNPMWEYLVYQYFLINHALSQVSGKEHFFINELRKENFIMYEAALKAMEDLQTKLKSA